MATTRSQAETDQDLLRRAETRFRSDGAVGTPVDGHPPHRVAPAPETMQQLIHDLHVHQIELEMQNEELQCRQLELAASQARYFTLYDLAPVGYLTLDHQGLIREANLTAATMMGVRRNSLLDRPLAQLLSPEDQDVYYLFRKRFVDTGELQACEIRLARADGSRFWSRLQVSQVQDGETRVTLSDISDSKRAEEERLEFARQLQQAKKMESLGVLVGGIAHDFNNILAIILGHCSLAKLKPTAAGDHLATIEKATGRAAELCRLMLTYAGKSKSVMAPVNMRALVDEMARMLKSTLRQNAVIIPDLLADIPLVNGDASQIRQIVMNLIINASEAVGESQGEIRVSLAKAEISARQPRKDHFGKDIPHGAYVCLEVSDNGCGMELETAQRIFDPFYSTKFSGSGLGLSAALGIITAHGGALQLSSRPGGGTTFRVYLPVQAGNAEAAATGTLTVPTDAWPGNGRILLVEDEELIRSAARDMLNELGIAVIEAAHGREAVDRYLENCGVIDLVMTDIGMPVMDGYELIRLLRERDPGLPVLITSGYGDAVVSSRIEAGETVGLLSKPYSLDQLRDALKRVVKETQRAPREAMP